MRIYLRFLFYVLILILCSCQDKTRSTKALFGREDIKPNVIFILADDLGIGRFKIALEGLGAEDFDPAMIDRDKTKYSLQKAYDDSFRSITNVTTLAQEGTYFSNCFSASPWCCPSRLSILTGQYPQRNGSWSSNDIRGGNITENSFFLSQLMSEAGYATGMIGKWHLGSNDFRGGLKPDQHPNAKGFDYFFGFDFSGTRYYNSAILRRNSNPAKSKGFLTNQFTSEALSFISDHKQEPFFLFLSYNTPHGPLDLTPFNHFENFGTKGQFMSNNVRGMEVTQLDDSSLHNNYNAHISAMDRGIGQIKTLLRSLKIDSNTIIIFTSDHGASGFESTTLPANSPYLGYKGQYYDGSIRVPLIFWSPLLQNAVQKVEDNVMLFDIMPTILSMAGVDYDRSELNLDGKDLSCLLGATCADLHKALFWAGMSSNHQAIDYNDRVDDNLGTFLVKNADYSLRCRYPNHVELYSNNDYREENEMSHSKKQIVRKLLDSYKDWYKGIAKRPLRNLDTYHQLNPEHF